ncbi:MAG: mechanosensitive ion channel family protein [Actinomycetota bacterium]|nr:mechanosensitive ion channel family protein [Actinomycetota bacterium]
MALSRLIAQTDVTVPEDLVPPGLTPLDWVWAATILAVAIVGAQVIRRLIQRGLGRGDSERMAAVAVGRFTGYLVVIGGLVYALSTLGVRLAPLLGLLGLAGLALAFALRDILENLLAGIMLQVRRPFRRGDQIMTNDYEGTVEDINLRTVILRTYDGERVLIPNSQVLTEPIVNFTARRLRRTNLTVGISYSADLTKAKEVLLSAVQTTEGVLPRPAPEVLVEEFGDSSVKLVVRFWHAPRIADLWRVRDAVAVELKTALDQAGLQIPFPQLTISMADQPGPSELD